METGEVTGLGVEDLEEVDQADEHGNGEKNGKRNNYGDQVSWVVIFLLHCAVHVPILFQARKLESSMGQDEYFALLLLASPQCRGGEI